MEIGGARAGRGRFGGGILGKKAKNELFDEIENLAVVVFLHFQREKERAQGRECKCVMTMEDEDEIKCGFLFSLWGRGFWLCGCFTLLHSFLF